jgi:hypothetical protein
MCVTENAMGEGAPCSDNWHGREVTLHSHYSSATVPSVFGVLAATAAAAATAASTPAKLSLCLRETRSSCRASCRYQQDKGSKHDDCMTA